MLYCRTGITCIVYLYTGMHKIVQLKTVKIGLVDRLLEKAADTSNEHGATGFVYLH